MKNKMCGKDACDGGRSLKCGTCGKSFKMMLSVTGLMYASFNLGYYNTDKKSKMFSYDSTVIVDVLLMVYLIFTI